jgi:excisionase family DNA binding protein
MSKNKDFLSARQLAEELNMHPQYVRDLARLGGIPSMKVGTSWRFSLSEVKAQLERNAALAVQRSMLSSTSNDK